MPDCLSRHPTELQGSRVEPEILWNKWFIVKCVICLEYFLENSQKTSEQKKKSMKSANERYGVNRVNEAKKAANQKAGQTQFAEKK